MVLVDDSSVLVHLGKGHSVLMERDRRFTNRIFGVGKREQYCKTKFWTGKGIALYSGTITCNLSPTFKDKSLDTC